MTITKKAKEALDRLLRMFETGNLPAAVARTTIQVKNDNKPSDKWSLSNRILMAVAGTEDARGFKQWQEAGRQVRKGAKAFYILGPCTKKKNKIVIDPDTEEERQEEKIVIIGFKTIPVFRVEDTEGNPLPEYDPPEPPPLFDVVKRFVDDIRYKPFIGGYYGYFNPARKEIVLNTHDASTFFHELAHAVHHQVKTGGLKGGQRADQEIVAETVSCALCEIYGFQGYIWHGWQYCKAYAGQDDHQALKAVMGVLADVEKVLNIILNAAEESSEEAA